MEEQAQIGIAERVGKSSESLANAKRKRAAVGRNQVGILCVSASDNIYSVANLS